MRILIIAPFIPYPLTSADAVRLYNLLKYITREHEVYLACLLDESPGVDEGVPHLREMCAGVEVAFKERKSRLKRLPGYIQYGLTGKPPELIFFDSRNFREKLQKLASTVDFDIVQIEHSCMGLYSEIFPQKPGLQRIMVIHNVSAQQWERIARVERGRGSSLRSMLYSWTMSLWEPKYAEKFNRIITVSVANKELLNRSNPRLKIDVVPNGVDTQLHKALPIKDISPNLIFVGIMEYEPNVDAAIYFCHEILPHIRAKIPEVRLWIVGKDPTPEVLALASDSVHVTGRVADVTPYYEQSSISVVPLRAGGGTRLKILEAMGLGRPVVTTTIGCEGLDVAGGEHLLIGDSPEEFSARVIDLLTDHALYRRIADGARKLVEEHYDWKAIGEQMLRIYSGMAGKNRGQ